MKLVVIESPYAPGLAHTLEENLAYVRRCMADCLKRGEAPYASHALYTQPGVLDDTVPGERLLGMNAGFEWGSRADARVIYVDHGISRGMREGAVHAKAIGQQIQFRALDREVTEADVNAIWL